MAELKQRREVNNLTSSVSRIDKTLDDHGNQIVNIQSITVLGFIIALITLAGVVIASIVFVTTQINQVNQQTVILQEIKDKLIDN